eukprot:3866915-Alexandrium_andersonii.AAC.1
MRHGARTRAFRGGTPAHRALTARGCHATRLGGAASARQAFAVRTCRAPLAHPLRGGALARRAFVAWALLGAGGTSSAGRRQTTAPAIRGAHT